MTAMLFNVVSYSNTVSISAGELQALARQSGKRQSSEQLAAQTKAAFPLAFSVNRVMHHKSS